MLVHPSSIDLSSRTLRYLAGHLTSRRQEIGTRWRRLAPGRQALLALAHLRCGDTYAQLAAGLPIDRIAADTPYHSGKHKRHGMNVQVLTDPFGRLLRASPALPGSTHDLTAARHHGITEALAAADLTCWADKAYQGAGGPVRVPFRGRRLKRWKRRHNTTHAKIRCLGERAMATLKRWRLRRSRVGGRPGVSAGTFGHAGDGTKVPPRCCYAL
ncbi:transposase family protein [Streptomyces sp. NPDC051567]|uniref:transposase family protein n=1 Tax=Streptomyces sp. NPDC051567 TaxID=3365660 RepID=UPI00378970DE